MFLIKIIFVYFQGVEVCDFGQFDVRHLKGGLKVASATPTPSFTTTTLGPASQANHAVTNTATPSNMPPALLRAHHKLDAAVDAAYVPSGGPKTDASDAERVAFLFELYQRITSLLPAPKPKISCLLNGLDRGSR